MTNTTPDPRYYSDLSMSLHEAMTFHNKSKQTIKLWASPLKRLLTPLLGPFRNAPTRYLRSEVFAIDVTRAPGVRKSRQPIDVNPEADPYMTRQEAAAYHGVTVHTIMLWEQWGRIRSHSGNGRRLYMADEIRRLPSRKRTGVCVYWDKGLRSAPVPATPPASK